MSLSEPTLDDVFLRQTGRSLRDTAADGATAERIGGGGMKLVRDTWLLFHRYTVQMLRNPVWLFVGFSTPLLYLVLFTPLLKHFSGPRDVVGHASSTCSSPASWPCWPSPAACPAGSGRSSSSSPASSSASG